MKVVKKGSTKKINSTSKKLKINGTVNVTRQNMVQNLPCIASYRRKKLLISQFASSLKTRLASDEIVTFFTTEERTMGGKSKPLANKQ